MTLPRPTLGVAVYYKDPRAALDWLEAAFGFERQMVISDADGALVHSQIGFKEAYVMVGSEWADYVASPQSVQGRNTQSISIEIDGAIDAHCERARAAGGVVMREPADQFYGDRTYSIRDPEGHVWHFHQKVADVSREDAERATGLKIEGWA